MKQYKNIIVATASLIVVLTGGWTLYNRYLESRFKRAIEDVVEQKYIATLNLEIYKTFPNIELKDQVLKAAALAGSLEYFKMGFDPAGNQIVGYKFKAPSRTAISELTPLAMKAQQDRKDMSLDQMKAFFAERSKDQSQWAESTDQVVMQESEGQWRALPRH
ncbi:hypothetical protein [Bdellovibrio sp. NC01]|uniref:hypothetical protein n=1 Tax=Bdellovibrio sp. NC01 TaxID=2220073 RepID=UPI00115808D2|nr:hypothetical protein [Bdellovibrio sp. NC01]QDK38472.1 hypothetical protein DOE51_13240 [Bdellovibrio sp. NC01]